LVLGLGFTDQGYGVVHLAVERGLDEHGAGYDSELGHLVKSHLF